VIWKSKGQHSAAYCRHSRICIIPGFPLSGMSALCSFKPVPVGEFYQFDAPADLAAIPDEIISLSIRIDPLNLHPVLTINACN
jgi:hypothetical protein